MERNTTENRSKAVWGARIALAAFVVLTLLSRVRPERWT